MEEPKRKRDSGPPLTDEERDLVLEAMKKDPRWIEIIRKYYTHESRPKEPPVEQPTDRMPTPNVPGTQDRMPQPPSAPDGSVRPPSGSYMFADGGAVAGPGTSTSDSIPARLSDGEFVFSANAVKYLGLDKLQKMMSSAEEGYRATNMDAFKTDAFKRDTNPYGFKNDGTPIRSAEEAAQYKQDWYNNATPEERAKEDAYLAMIRQAPAGLGTELTNAYTKYLNETVGGDVSSYLPGGENYQKGWGMYHDAGLPYQQFGQLDNNYYNIQPYDMFAQQSPIGIPTTPEPIPQPPPLASMPEPAQEPVANAMQQKSIRQPKFRGEMTKLFADGGYVTKDKKKVMSILEKNKDKNFVKRILDPNIYPNIPSEKKGMIATHEMSDSDNIAYPNIIQEPNGELKRLTPDKAYSHAVDTGEYIEFSSPEEANWFAKNYKAVWGD